MNSNNLTAILAALAIVPLHFKEPSQPAPEKWWSGSCGVFWDGSSYQLTCVSSHIGTQARKGPTGDWVVSQNDKVLSRHKTEDEALEEMLTIQTNARVEMGDNGWCLVQVDDVEIGYRFWYKRPQPQ